MAAAGEARGSRGRSEFRLTRRRMRLPHLTATNGRQHHRRSRRARCLPGRPIRYCRFPGIFDKVPFSNFPRRAWSSFNFSIVVLGEFVQQVEGGKSWHQATIAEPVPGQAKLHQELDELIELIEYRAGVLAEASAQRAGMLDYFRGILPFSQQSHPYTVDLAQSALRVAQFVVMHFKQRHNIPRPSQLSPALLPPLAVPPHASWPSGHATEAWLLVHA
ncbi:MAG: hypothetical protein IPK78_07915 [Rhodospirillales bacterium]|nr:hypothetical protein [Rhodospirillales bacterium]